MQFLATACIALLSWQQAGLRADMPAATWVLLAVGGLAAWLTCRSHRYGYVSALLLGVGYQAEILVKVRWELIDAVQPLLVWSATLAACGAGLLWSSRERKPPKPVYERHLPY